MSIKRLLCVLLVLVFVAGCAKRSSNISATYVSPLMYQPFNCEQIEQERSRIVRKVRELSGTQDSEASKDAFALTVGLVIFWPALFMMIGDDKKDEIARLKGEYEAIEVVSVEKKCKSQEQVITTAEEREKIVKKDDGTISFIDEEIGTEWLIIKDSDKVDHAGAVKLCKLQSVEIGKTYKLPSLKDFENLRKRYIGTDIAKMFGKGSFVVNEELRWGKVRLYSFRSGTSDGGYVGYVACIDEKKEWYK